MKEPTVEELLAAGDPRFLKKVFAGEAEAKPHRSHGPETPQERQEHMIEHKAKMRRKMEAKSRKVNRKIAAKKRKPSGSKRRK